VVEQGTHKSLTASAVIRAWERERNCHSFLVDPDLAAKLLCRSSQQWHELGRSLLQAIAYH